MPPSPANPPAAAPARDAAETAFSQLVKASRDSPLRLLQHYLKANRPGVIAFSACLAACARRRLQQDGRAIYRIMQERGVQPNIFTFNALIALAPTLPHLHTTVLAMQNAQVERTLHTYNAVIRRLIDFGEPDAALEVFRAMAAQGHHADLVVVGSILRACTHLRMAVNIVAEFVFHGGRGLRLGAPIATSLYGLCMTSEDVDDVDAICDRQGVDSDGLLCVARAKALVRAGRGGEVVALWKAMDESKSVSALSPLPPPGLVHDPRHRLVLAIAVLEAVADDPRVIDPDLAITRGIVLEHLPTVMGRRHVQGKQAGARTQEPTGGCEQHYTHLLEAIFHVYAAAPAPAAAQRLYDLLSWRGDTLPPVNQMRVVGAYEGVLINAQLYGEVAPPPGMPQAGEEHRVYHTCALDWFPTDAADSGSEDEEEGSARDAIGVVVPDDADADPPIDLEDEPAYTPRATRDRHVSVHTAPASWAASRELHLPPLHLQSM